MKTLEEFRSDLKALRREMFDNSEMLDTKLVASYLDRLIMQLEDVTLTLQGMETEMEVMCKCCEMEMPAAAPKPKKAAKKSKKAPKKKPMKKKRR